MIGNATPVCPHCAKSLDKMPGRKKKCPHCGQYMYVRTRPDDRQRVLVTEEGVHQIEEQWMFEHAMYSDHPVDRGALQAHRSALTRKLGHEPSERDVHWSLLNSQLVEHARNSNWGLYCNTRLSMAELLTREKKFRHALDTYLEISYLDANGARNVGAESDPELLRLYPPFSKDAAFQAPAIVNRIGLLARRLDMSESDLESAFLGVAEKLHRNMKLPVSPQDGWHDFVAAGGGVEE